MEAINETEVANSGAKPEVEGVAIKGTVQLRRSDDVNYGTGCLCCQNDPQTDKDGRHFHTFSIGIKRTDPPPTESCIDKTWADTINLWLWRNRFELEGQEVLITVERQTERLPIEPLATNTDSIL